MVGMREVSEWRVQLCRCTHVHGISALHVTSVEMWGSWADCNFRYTPVGDLTYSAKHGSLLRVGGMSVVKCKSSIQNHCCNVIYNNISQCVCDQERGGHHQYFNMHDLLYDANR